MAEALEKALEQEFEDKSLGEILDASPAALSGITDAKEAALKERLGIKTLGELGSNKFFAVTGVLVALENKSGAHHARSAYSRWRVCKRGPRPATGW